MTFEEARRGSQKKWEEALEQDEENFQWWVAKVGSRRCPLCALYYNLGDCGQCLLHDDNLTCCRPFDDVLQAADKGDFDAFCDAAKEMLDLIINLKESEGAE